MSTTIQFLEFPDSGWSLSVVNSNSRVVLSLHWRDKMDATHQMILPLSEFKNILKKADIDVDKLSEGV